MVATHLRRDVDADGALTATQWLAGGRASALFAVLAGVSLALLFRRQSRASLAVRALLIAALGLALGALDVGIAVILTYYGVLFLLALPFVGLRSRALLPLAAVWVVAGPVLTQLVRPHLPERGFDSPSFDSLEEPGRLVSELLFTGYYPAAVWLAYVLLGLAIGRADLRSRRVQAALVVGGATAAVTATLVSRWLTARDAVAERLLADSPVPHDRRPARGDRLRPVRPDTGRRVLGLAAGRGAAQQHAVRPRPDDGERGAGHRRLRGRRRPGGWVRRAAAGGALRRRRR